MPRTSKMMRSEVLSLPKTTAVVASAALMPGTIPTGRKRKRTASPEAWQGLVWSYFDTVTEYHYAVTWVGNLLSKAKLVVHENGKPTEDQLALDMMASLFGGPDGQTEMLRLLGINFTVTGEAYIVGLSNTDTDRENEDDDWMVVPGTQLQSSGTAGKFTVYGDVIEDAFVIRLWRPHPAMMKLPDSPSRAAISVLSQIQGLSAHIDAQINSRLAGAGILFLPSEITFATGKTEEGATAANSTEAFVQMLAATMSAARASDPGDPESLTPIVVQASGEYLDKIHHMTFWSELEEHAVKLREEAISRLGTGMDMPPEILTGQGDMNHWSSWQIEEAAIKAHTEPLLSVIVAALNKGYLHPLLMAEGKTLEEARTFSIVPDTSQMRLRPNRSAEAIELYDRGVLNAEAVVRENGFDPGDRMEDEERKLWLIRKIAQGSTTPELVEAAIAYLGAALPVKEPEAAESVEVQEARPTRSLEEHPRREPPEEESLVAAAEVMVHRALERAGNRLKTRMGSKDPDVPAADRYQFVNLDASTVDSLLEDAWGMTEKFCYGKDPAKLTACLDGYTRALLMEKAPHDRELLVKHLSLMEN